VRQSRTQGKGGGTQSSEGVDNWEGCWEGGDLEEKETLKKKGWDTTERRAEPCCGGKWSLHRNATQKNLFKRGRKGFDHLLKLRTLVGTQTKVGKKRPKDKKGGGGGPPSKVLQMRGRSQISIEEIY